MTTDRRLFLTSMAAALANSSLNAQQSSYVPKQSDRPEMLSGDEPGFQPIFDGKSLNGWEGDPKYWSVSNGAIVGRITPETVIKSNTFLIWRGGSPGNFELKVDYRISASGNSGINYRSVVVPDTVTPSNRFAMRGYQADIDSQNQYTGQNYEEKGRLFLALRGQMTHVIGGQKPIALSSLGNSDDLRALITNDWNSFHLIVRENVLVHMLNGHVMCVVIDDDVAHRTMNGLIGVQVHVGPPMKVEYRNFRLKNL